MPMWRHISAFLSAYFVYLRKGLTTYTVWADLELILLLVKPLKYNYRNVPLRPAQRHIPLAMSKQVECLASIITQLLKLRVLHNPSKGIKTYPVNIYCEPTMFRRKKNRRLEDSQYSVDFVLCLEIITGNHPKSPLWHHYTIRGYELLVNQESDE